MTRTSALPRIGSLTHRVGTLAMAAMLALTVAGSLAAPALAKPPRHPADNGVRCAYYNPQTGEIEMHMVWDLITVGGKDLVCGEDGNWFAIRALPLSPVGAVAPQSPPAAAQQ
jgi:hypothetical protein